MVPPPFMLKEAAIRAVPNTLLGGRSRFSQRSATKSSEALQSRLAAVSISAMPTCQKPIRRSARSRSARWKPPHSLLSDHTAKASNASHANGAMTARNRLRV